MLRLRLRSRVRARLLRVSISMSLVAVFIPLLLMGASWSLSGVRGHSVDGNRGVHAGLSHRNTMMCAPCCREERTHDGFPNERARLPVAFGAYGELSVVLRHSYNLLILFAHDCHQRLSVRARSQGLLSTAGQRRIMGSIQADQDTSPGNRRDLRRMIDIVVADPAMGHRGRFHRRGRQQYGAPVRFAETPANEHQRRSISPGYSEAGPGPGAALYLHHPRSSRGWDEQRPVPFHLQGTTWKTSTDWRKNV